MVWQSRQQPALTLFLLFRSCTKEAVPAPSTSVGAGQASCLIGTAGSACRTGGCHHICGRGPVQCYTERAHRLWRGGMTLWGCPRRCLRTTHCQWQVAQQSCGAGAQCSPWTSLPRTVNLNVRVLLPPLPQVLLIPQVLVAASSNDVLTWTAPGDHCPIASCMHRARK